MRFYGLLVVDINGIHKVQQPRVDIKIYELKKFVDPEKIDVLTCLCLPPLSNPFVVGIEDHQNKWTGSKRHHCRLVGGQYCACMVIKWRTTTI